MWVLGGVAGAERFRCWEGGRLSVGQECSVLDLKCKDCRYLDGRLRSRLLVEQVSGPGGLEDVRFTGRQSNLLFCGLLAPRGFGPEYSNVKSF